MPWKRSFSISRASSSLRTLSAPPSIEVMFLLGWKLNDTMSPSEPIFLPCHDEPIAKAASSITRTPARRASAYSRSRSSGAFQWVGMSARVAGVIAASVAARSWLRVTRSQSTNTALAPTISMTLAVAKKLCAEVTTSSPGPMPATCNATCSARTGRPPK